MEEINEYIVTAYTENQVGVLNRITAIYLRRKINIESLRVSETAIKGVSMFVISAFTTRETIEKVRKHIMRIIEVMEVDIHLPSELITRHIGLYKLSKQVFATKENNELITLNKKMSIVEIGDDYVVTELPSTRAEITLYRTKFAEKGLLLQYGISGRVILHREELEIRKLLEKSGKL